MPYLTLWDKISQNSAYLKADSQKNFQISEFLDKFIRSKYKSHFIVSVKSLLKINKGNKIHLGSLKAIFVTVSQNFIKSHLKFYLISQISAYSLWHVCLRLYETVKGI